VNEVGIIAIIVAVSFVFGYDFASYRTMKKIDPLYKSVNKWIIGYNSYKVWQSYRKYKNGNNEA